MLWALNVILLFLSLSFPYLMLCQEEYVRHRKSWYSLTMQEKELYIEGFQNIRKNGKMDIITKSHAMPEVVPSVHYTSYFSFFHTYLVWEVETAIRELGGKFKCFSMPYWDWTRDTGLEDDPPILNSGIGGDGFKSAQFCVMSDGTGSSWDVCSSAVSMDISNAQSEQCYWSPFPKYCGEEEDIPHCCLKRVKSTTQILVGATQIGQAIYNYPDFEDFQSMINYWHNNCHNLLAAKDNAHMVNGYAPDDPSFMMLHAFVAYLRSLWSDCYDYDEIPLEKLDIHYDAYHPYCGTFDAPTDLLECHKYTLGLDDAFNLYEIGNADWSKSYYEDITVRKLYHPSKWNVVYELGTFWETSGVNKWCENNLNSGWFVQTMSYQDEMDGINDVNKHSADLFDEFENDENEWERSEIINAVSSLSCQYIRESSGNSCYDEELANIKKEVCDRSITRDELDAMTLSDMLNMDGVRDNECLKTIRKEIYPRAEYYMDIKYHLCRGEYDYKCPEWKSKYEIETKQHGNSYFFDGYIDSWIAMKNIVSQYYVWMIAIILSFISLCIILRYIEKSKNNIKKCTHSNLYGSV